MVISSNFFSNDTKDRNTNYNTYNDKIMLQSVIIFGLRFAFFTHISGKKRTVKRTVSKYVR